MREALGKFFYLFYFFAQQAAPPFAASVLHCDFDISEQHFSDFAFLPLFLPKAMGESAANELNPRAIINDRRAIFDFIILLFL